MIALADLKVELDIESSDTEFDTYLTALEPRAVAYVERRTNRYFGVVDEVTEYLYGIGTPNLSLFDNANVAPTAVLERVYPGGTPATISASAVDGFLVRSDARNTWLVRKNGAVWHDGYEYETVGLHRGYVAGTEPGEIRQLVIDLIANRFATRGSGGAGIQSETIGGYSYKLGDFSDGDLSALGPMAQDTIKMWTRPVFG